MSRLPFGVTPIQEVQEVPFADAADAAEVSPPAPEPVKAAKEPDPLKEPVALVFTGLDARRKVKYPRRSDESQAIRRMLMQGHDPPKILGCYDGMKREPYWAERALYMSSVEKRIPEWRPGSGRPNTNQHNPAGHGPPEPERAARDAAFAARGF